MELAAWPHGAFQNSWTTRLGGGLRNSMPAQAAQNGLPTHAWANHSRFPIFLYPRIPISQYPCIPLSPYAAIPISWYPNIPVSGYRVSRRTLGYWDIGMSDWWAGYWHTGILGVPDKILGYWPNGSLLVTSTLCAHAFFLGQ